MVKFPFIRRGKISAYTILPRDNKDAGRILDSIYFETLILYTVYKGARTRASVYLGTKLDSQIYLGTKILFP